MLANRVREFTTTVGTGDITLGGAFAGHVRFADAFTTGDSVVYVIEDNDNYEIGTGTLSGPGILARTTILETLVDGTLTKTSATAIDLSGNAKIYCAVSAEYLLNPTKEADIIREITLDGGVTVDGVLLKDGGGVFTGNITANTGTFTALNEGGTALNAKYLGLADNAVSAAKLETPRTISISGDASGTVDFDGSAPVDIALLIADNSHDHTVANITGLSTALGTKFDKTGGTISGDVTIAGTVTVSGDLLTQSSNDVNIGDSIITLNAELAAARAPSLDAGFEINRGNVAKSYVLFREGTDEWDLSHSLNVQGGGVFSGNVSSSGYYTSTRPNYAKIVLHSTTPGVEWIVENATGDLKFTVGGVAAVAIDPVTHAATFSGTQILKHSNSTMVELDRTQLAGIDNKFTINVDNITGTSDDFISMGPNSTAFRVYGDNNVSVGADLVVAGSILSDNNTGGIVISSDTSVGAGSNIVMYPSAHATRAYDMDLRASSTPWLTWDHSALTATFLGNIIASDALELKDGSIANLSLTFSNDLNTGIYRRGSDQLAFVTGGLERGYWAADGALIAHGKVEADRLYTKNGTAALPSYSWVNDTDTGMYRSSANVLVLATGGSSRLLVGSFGLQNTVNGTAAAPSYTFGSDTNTGMYLQNTDALGLTTNGTLRVEVNASGLHSNINGSAAFPSYSYRGDSDTGMFLAGTNQLGITTGGSMRAVFNSLGIEAIGQVFASVGSAAVPSHSFTGDTDTGMYRVGTNVLGFATNGTARFRIDNDALKAEFSGTAAAPAYSWASDGNTGIYRAGIDAIGFSAGGVQRFGVTSAAIFCTEQLTGYTGGSAAAPSFAFGNDTNTGMYRIAADTVGISCNGTVTLTVAPTFTRSAGQWHGPNGSVTGASYAFSSDGDTGMYLPASGLLGFTAGGAERIRISSQGIRSMANGSTALPTYTWNNDPDTGFYLVSSGIIGVTVAGALRIQMSSAGLGVQVGSAAAPTYHFSGDTNTGMYRPATDVLALVTGGAERLRATAAGIDVFGDLRVSDNILGNNSNSDLIIAGGTSGSSDGGNITLFGGSHATLANDTRFRAGATTWMYHDASAGTVDFQTNDLTNVGNIDVGDNTVNYKHVRFNANRTGSGQSLGGMDAYWNNTRVALIEFQTNASTTAKDGGEISMYTALGGVLTERLRINDSGFFDFKSNDLSGLGNLRLEAGRSIFMNSVSSSMLISGGTSDVLGGNIILRGEAHGTEANDILFRASGNLRLRWDESEAHWNFQEKALAGVGNVTMSGGQIVRSVDTAEGVFSGGSGPTSGGNFLGYGGSRTTRANDFVLRAGATDALYFDSSASMFDFKANTLTGVGNVVRGSATALMTVAGGSNVAQGGNIQLYGESHATRANEMAFRVGGTEKLSHDGLGRWDFHINHLDNVGDITMSGTDIFRNDNTNQLSLSGGLTYSQGAGITLYGFAHPTFANDIAFASAGNAKLVYDASASTWDFQGKELKGLGNTQFLGANLSRNIDNSYLQIEGGTTGNRGANIILRGPNGSSGNDMEFKVGADLILNWDSSNNYWDFKGHTIYQMNSIIRGNATDNLAISGGSSEVLGANMLMFGESHATQSNDILLRTGTTLRMYWDSSEGNWNFAGSPIIGVGNVTMSGDTVRRDVSNEYVVLSGDVDGGTGANFWAYGSTHASANDFRFRNGATTILHWDASANYWNYNATRMTGVLDIDRGVTNDELTISGSSSNSNGGNLRLYGSTHATNANDIFLRVGGASVLHWDNSANLWDFEGKNIVGVGNVTMFGTRINRTADTSNLEIYGGTGTTGGNILLYGPTHATLANDIFLRAGGSAKLQWNQSADIWDYLGTSVRNIATLTLTNELRLPQGSVSDPSLSFEIFSNSGLYMISTTSMGVSVGGVLQMSVSDTTVDIQGNKLENVGQIKSSIGVLIRDVNTAQMQIAGGNATNQGGNIVLNGGTFAGGAGDIIFRSGSSDKLTWDESANYWNYQGYGLNSVGNVQMSGDRIVRNTTGNQLILSGSTTSDTGANILLYGNTHSTVAGDLLFRSGVDQILRWDESANIWDFQTKDIRGVRTLSMNGDFIGRQTNVSHLFLSGGINGSSGAAILLHGGDRAIDPNDMFFRANNVTKLHYDYSAATWDFQDNDTTTTGTVTAGALASAAGVVRPDPTGLPVGSRFFDTAVGKPVYVNAAQNGWVDWGTGSGGGGSSSLPDAITVDGAAPVGSFSINSTGDAAFSGDVTAPLLLADNGTAGTPTYSFTGDTNTGMYRVATDTVGISCNGTVTLTVAPTLTRSAGQWQGPNGIAAGPSYAFSSDGNTGMYLPSGDLLGFAAGGNVKMYIGATGMRAAANGSVTDPAWGFNNDNNTGMYLVGTDTLGFTAGGVQRLLINSSGLYSSTNFNSANGSAASPSHTFTTDTNTGMYRPATDTLALVTGGTERLRARGTGIDVFGDLSVTGTLSVAENIVGNSSATDLVVSGGPTSSDGGNITLYGSTHAGANDIRFRFGAELALYGDASSNSWNFQGNNLKGVSSLVQGSNSNTLVMSGGSTTVNGANVVLYAQTHATKSNDLEFKAGTLTKLLWDNSNNWWNFEGQTIVGTPVIARGNNTTEMYLSGGDGTGSGGNIRLRGGAHPTEAGDIALRSGTLVKLAWDQSQSRWDFTNQNIVNVQSIFKGNGTGIFKLSGGTNVNVGGNFWGYGETHATQANDIELRAAGLVKLQCGLWDFQGNALTGVDNITMSSNRINRNTDTSNLEIYGGTGTTGGNILLYGPTHATRANDVYLRSGGADRLAWDNSGNHWQFYDNDVKGVGDITMSGDGISRNIATNGLFISGGSSTELGGNVVFFGESHATQSNDILLRTGTTNRLHWDSSEGNWDFLGSPIIQVGDITMSGDSINRSVTNDDLTLSGGSGPNLGANIRLRGEAHATEANDLVFASGNTARLRWDNSLSKWDYNGTRISGVTSIGSTGASSSLLLTGSEAVGFGANIELFGNTHATQAWDIDFKTNGTVRLRWDDSAVGWDFQGNDITTTGTITGGMLSSQHGTTAARPSGAALAALNPGARYYDTDLDKPVYVNAAKDGWVEGGGGGGAGILTVVTANTVAVLGDVLAVDSSVAAITLTAPTSPPTGAHFRVFDIGGNSATNIITIDFGAESFNGTPGDDFIHDINSESFGFTYTGTTWRVSK